MAAVLTYAGRCPVVKVGRIAGQFAKPRSAPTETDRRRRAARVPRPHGATTSRRPPPARVPDPDRLVQAYHQSAATLNLLRAFTKGGFADLTRVHSWNQEFVATLAGGPPLRGDRRRDRAGAARSWPRAGSTSMSERRLHEVDVCTSHEALLLGYEEALTRQDSLTGDWYDCSAHMLWIGERTRQLDGAHVEFFAGVRNPLGCKIGPTATADELVDLCERLDPDRTPGRLTLIAPHGRGPGRGRAPAAPPRGARRRPPGRVGVRPDARQHVSHVVGLQDAPLRRHHGGDRRLLRGLPRRRRRGRAASTSSSPART